MRDMRHEELEKLNWRLGLTTHILLGVAAVLGIAWMATMNHILLVLGATFAGLGTATFFFWWGISHADKAIAGTERQDIKKEEQE